MGEESSGQAFGVTSGTSQPPRVDCTEAIHQLYHFLDGELTEERRTQITRHLDDCPPCAEATGFEAELRHVVASRCKDRVPDALLARVKAAIEAERQSRRGG